MIVSKSFKHLIDRHVKKGGTLAESGLSAHKDFDPFVEELARNSPSWGDRAQHGWNFKEIDFGGNHVHVYFKDAGGPGVMGVSLPEDVVLEGLKNAQTEEN
jgi:hypothetical protein